jgi:hypothetical protein
VFSSIDPQSLGLKPLHEDLTKIHIEAPKQRPVFDEGYPLPRHAARASAELAKAFARLTDGPRKEDK